MQIAPANVRRRNRTADVYSYASWDAQSLPLTLGPGEYPSLGMGAAQQVFITT